MLSPKITLPTISQEFALNTIRAARGFGRLDGMITQLGKRLSDFGISMTLAVSIPLQVLGGAIVKSFADLDQAVTKAFSKIIGASQEVKSQMFDAVVTMSQATATSAVDLAGGLTELVASGYSASEAIESLWVADHLAIAGNMSLTDATKTLITAMAAMQERTGNLIFDQQRMIHISDLLVKAADATVGSVEDYSVALNRKAATALRTVNKSLEEGVAVLMTYIQAGVSAASASEYLNIATRDLQTAMIRKGPVWQKFGMNIFDATGKMKSYADIIEMMEKRFAGASDKQLRMSLRMLGFQDRSVMATMKLFGLSQQIRNYEAELKSAGGTTEKVFKVQMASLSNQMAITKNMVAAVGTGIGQMLVPYIILLNMKIREMVDWWNSLSESQRKNIVHWGVIIAIAGPVLLALSVVILTIGRTIGMISQLGYTLVYVATQSIGMFITGLRYAGQAILWLGQTILPILFTALQYLAMAMATIVQYMVTTVIPFILRTALSLATLALQIAIVGVRYLLLGAIWLALSAIQVAVIAINFLMSLSFSAIAAAIWGAVTAVLAWIAANMVLIGWIVLIGVAVVAAAAAIWYFWDSIVSAVKVAWTYLQTFFSWIWTVITWIATPFVWIAKKIWSVFVWLVEKVFWLAKIILYPFIWIGKKIYGIFSGVVKYIVDAFVAAFGKVVEFFGWLFGVISDEFWSFVDDMKAGLVELGAKFEEAFKIDTTDIEKQLKDLGVDMTKMQMPEMPSMATAAQKTQRDALAMAGVAGVLSPAAAMAMGVGTAVGTGPIAEQIDLMKNAPLGGTFDEVGDAGKSKGSAQAAQYSGLQYGTVEEYKARVQGQNSLMSVAQQQLAEQKKGTRGTLAMNETLTDIKTQLASNQTVQLAEANV